MLPACFLCRFWNLKKALQSTWPIAVPSGLSLASRALFHTLLAFKPEPWLQADQPPAAVRAGPASLEARLHLAAASAAPAGLQPARQNSTGGGWATTCGTRAARP